MSRLQFFHPVIRVIPVPRLCHLCGLGVNRICAAASVHEIAAAANTRSRGENQFNPKTPYGLGAPGMVFGRVARWTIRPTIGTNQPRTTTSVLFGDWRRAESFMIQIAIQSQMATEIRIGINIIPQAPATIPAAALSLSSIGVGLAVASSWARRAVAVGVAPAPASALRRASTARALGLVLVLAFFVLGSPPHQAGRGGAWMRTAAVGCVLTP